MLAMPPVCGSTVAVASAPVPAPAAVDVMVTLAFDRVSGAPPVSATVRHPGFLNGLVACLDTPSPPLGDPPPPARSGLAPLTHREAARTRARALATGRRCDLRGPRDNSAAGRRVHGQR